MAFNRERILELIDLKHRRSSMRRVLSVAGLLLGGGLIGATIMVLMRPRSHPPAEDQFAEAPRPSDGAVDSLPPSTAIHEGNEVLPLRDGHAPHG